MDVEVEGVERLRFADGSPVRAASAVVPLGDGFLVVQDDATHAAWFVEGRARAVRLLPPVAGLELFEESARTKHLKPDLEAACALTVDGAPAALALGSGSSPARMRWALLRLVDGEPVAHVVDADPVYDAVAAALDVPPDVLNLEGACVVGDVLRWFHRGLPALGLPSGSVDLDLAAVVAVAGGAVDPSTLAPDDARSYDLGELAGVPLAVTDAVVQPDGRIVVSAAAEDTPNPRDDGPVVASALVLLDDTDPVELTPLPLVDGRVCKVEGLMLLAAEAGAVRLLAVVDVDDPLEPSLALRLRLHPL